MGQQRYSPEFKDEAVRQVTERGYSVQEVAARIGVSAHSPGRNRRDDSIALHRTNAALKKRAVTALVACVVDCLGL